MRQKRSCRAALGRGRSRLTWTRTVLGEGAVDSERQRRRPEAVHVVESLEEFCKKAAEKETEV